MALMTKIRDYLQTAFGNSGSKAEVGAIFAEEMYATAVKMGVVVMVFEAMMMVSSLLQGGPGADLRRQLYFFLYLLLFVLTAIFMCALVYLHTKMPDRTEYQLNLSFAYAVCLCSWGCAITLLDQRSGTNITVYSYLLMATAVFCIIKPWQSLLVFVGSFALLNGAALLLDGNPIFFSAPLKIYSIFVNSFFTTILTIIIAITLYRYRVTKRHDQMVIQQQYDQIRVINQKLNDLVMTDQLTGVGNRRFLEERMQQLARPDGQGCAMVTGMMLDIDFFKQYNDHYGHQAGDHCLQALATVLQTFATQQDALVVRYGGEEFFLCLPGCHDALQKADALRKAILAQNLVRDDLPSGCVTVSIGVDVQQDWREMGQDAFLRRCDEALYDAKRAGRNTVRLYGAGGAVD